MIDENLRKVLNEPIGIAPEEQIRKTQKKGKWIPISFILIPIIVYFAMLSNSPLRRVLIAFEYPFQLDAEEGFLLNQAVLLANKKPIYKPIDEIPYIVGNYGPIYPFLFSLMVKGKESRIEIGRFICFSAFVGILMAMFMIIIFKGKSVAPALLAPLLFFATYDTNDWLPFARVDMVAIFFSVCGLMTLCIEDTPGARILSILFFLAAIFTKPIQIAAPISVGIFLLIKNKKSGLFWIKTLIFMIILTFAILTIRTKGEFFKHTILYNANKFDLWQIKVGAIHLARFQKYLLISSIFIFLIELLNAFTMYFRSEISEGDFKFSNYIHFSLKKIDLIYIYFFFAMLMFPSIAKIGSAPNYLLEIHIAVALVICTKLGQVLREIENGFWFKKVSLLPATVWLLIIVGLLIAHSKNLYDNRNILYSSPNPTARDQINCSKVLDIVLEHSGPIFSEEPIFNILAGRRVEVQPFIMSQLAKEGKWNQTDLVRKFKQGYFSLIIANMDLMNPDQIFLRYTDEMLKAIRTRYRPYKEFNTSARTHYYIYIPRRWDKEDFHFNIVLNEKSKMVNNSG